MKKKKVVVKLNLEKQSIAHLTDRVTGGRGSVASVCYSCMSQCLCNPPR
ncbi:hypothetical protein [Taibaiella chishuiensis]|uniref:Uncharacterized protein n=1 Tax=Taibaiella chishuiensis TaxID=1434707 RepID=A0A2P8CZQ4_9BACT|nr:hypothetical protein [Taibaiella chishuiensis]PSK90427.1 hypothetical protein B0I18_108157 [Taibaiella chishuiensis]